MTDIKTLMPGYGAYKDSGVEWIGEIPAHWEAKKLKFLNKVNMGQSPNSVDCNTQKSGIPFLQGNAEFGEYSPTPRMWCAKPKKVANIGDILLSVRAPVGALNVADVKIGIGRGLCAIIPDPVNRVFKLFQLKSIASELHMISTGSTFEAISVSDIKNLILPTPPLEEQTAIANFLDCKTNKIDQTVAIKEKQIRLLKERKQILIQNAVTKGLDPDVPMRDSGVEWIGDIPHHWDIVANRILFNERVEPGKDGLPLLSVSIHSGISDDEVSEEDNIRGRVKIEDKTKYNLVEPNDIVFNMMRAWQGAIGSSRVKGMVSPAYIIAEPTGEIFSPYFECQYRCPIFIAQMDRFSKGITDFRKRLYWHEFKQLLTVRPPIDEQKAIVSHIQAQSAKIDKAVAIQEQMIEKLKEYKATLINSAVTGKIKVPQTGEAKAVV